MADLPNLSQEEMEALVEKAKRELQAQLDRMTPQEREAAQRKAQQMIEEDQAATQKLLDDAAALLAGTAPKEKPKFCTHCGAAVNAGKFCEYCGMPY